MSQKNSAVRLISYLKNLILAIFALILILVLTFPIGFYGMAMYLEPSLPNIKELKKMPLEMPLQIYTADHKLIGQYGNRYSLPVAYEDIPETMIQAFLAAEDDTFFEHTGISVKGLGRAITEMISTTDGQTGGSSITQQVAKNYFLSPEQTFERKLNELFIARKIENELSKKEIMTLYVNKIYLGQGAYGIRAAAKRYYSKSLNNLTIAEMAMLAGLPKAPSDFNPVINPKRALERRNWIIGRMLAKGYITQAEHDEALSADIGLNMYQEQLDLNLPYIAEMARSALVERYGAQVMDSGWRVQLTIDSADQLKARQAVLNGTYSHNAYTNGVYRGVEALTGDLAYFKPFTFRDGERFRDMLPAKVVEVKNGQIRAELQSGETVRVFMNMRYADSKVGGKRRGFGTNLVAGDRKELKPAIEVGNIIRVTKQGNSWYVTQPPRTQGALVAMNPQNGALEAVAGGFHFNQSKFNRATQGYRQPGSIIKPLIYAATFENSKLSPGDVISNAPIRIGNWQPKNAGGGAGGAVSISSALARSLNLPSIRMMQKAGVEPTREMLSQFGLEKDRLPQSLTLALGATDATPLQMATAYATFANGGHRIQPYFIERIYNFDNQTIFQANPLQACAVCFNKELSKVNTQLLDSFGHTPADEETSEQTTDDALDKEKNTKKDQEPPKKIDHAKALVARIHNAHKALDAQQVAYRKENPTLDAAPIFDRLKPKQAIQFGIAEQAPRILSVRTSRYMASMLKGVMTGGTGRKGNFRSDLGGKTGTTNQAKDVWFAGLQRNHVAVVWIGYDEPASLGAKAYGGTLAMPVWVDYMKHQLKDEPTKWVDDGNLAKSKKTEQRIIDITDENEAEAMEEIAREEAEEALANEILGNGDSDMAESSGDEVIPEGDGENIPEGQ
ncbi:transglycosylase domain-containing protein [Moraxella bovis]|uniref:peptidoglycan glycosyltransferase n=1 Tax=Moraxella bovis TaxID=476 RepID=A0AAQ2T1Z4_MORBO|nr:transglycosylase domain-containing protein [Moraxella bovis]AWY19637.1 penicillin-binding protein 1A [Moraxella bovis]UYZ75240.1 transglycosylase domain-containing protein [Moraxella bovis]UYZ78828.1 transglycosylase domain-containing protein [Moraxella bovis]UYZ80587.1 transglycosylase domain-containing protein [Moraxella bovis]UYZ87311.1 transglycosylase domain-containing protein [Moraxella bovis]